ncbi:MAG: response regulator [Bacteroidota bacterium]|jgi:two-component system, sensor histidine kinase and response regulator
MDSTLKNANILIVDDNEANIDILAGLLDFQGYTSVKTTTDPRQIDVLFNTFKPDILLLDLLMPHLSGFEVMEQLRTKIPAGTFFPILVLTADMTTETKQLALSAGANDFLVKPFDMIEAGLRIKNLLEARYIHQQIEGQNQILEEKVKERTQEIEKKNIELILAKDKAEASDRLKTAFMQNISHEVRTPLNGILGFGALLAEQDVSDSEKEQYLSLLKASSTRLINTITDYMDISLIVSDSIEVNRKPLSVNKVLTELMNQFYDQCLSKKLEFNLSTPGDSNGLFILTDPELFRKIISHLLDNAVKFTNKGSITLGYSVLPDNIEFFVKDTGVGIEKDAQERIFESFMQENLDNTRGHDGSGLGLSIIKGFTKLLDGEILLESVKGEGATFYFSIPKGMEINENEEARRSVTNYRGSHLPAILIAEDEFAHRIYLGSFLKKYTSMIFMATNGKEAVELCRKHPGISMILMDIKMPLMNGLEATREIRSFRKDIPIIAISAHAMTGDEKKALDAGCNGFIAKPTSGAELLEGLKSYGIFG